MVSVQRKPLIILAQSGRWLAHAAYQSQLRVTVVDGFADIDTQRYADRVVRVDWSSIDTATLTETLIRLAAGEPHDLICASGIERHYPLLARLPEHIHYHGNSPQVFAATTTPQRWLRLLQRLRIPHPTSRLSPPGDLHAWLSKEPASWGGAHIRIAEQGSATAYYQEMLPGQSVALNFWAHNGISTPLSLHRQGVQGSGANPMRFQSLQHPWQLDSTAYVCALDSAQKLTQALHLEGLNSLDFLVHGSQIWVLELNARPSASCQLLEDWPWLDWQLQHQPFALPASPIGQHRLYSVVYAAQSVTIPPDILWPDACCDLPQSGCHIAADAPICSVLLKGESIDALEKTRQSLASTLARQLGCHLEIGKAYPQFQPTHSNV